MPEDARGAAAFARAAALRERIADAAEHVAATEEHLADVRENLADREAQGEHERERHLTDARGARDYAAAERRARDELRAGARRSEPPSSEHDDR